MLALISTLLKKSVHRNIPKKARNNHTEGHVPFLLSIAQSFHCHCTLSLHSSALSHISSCYLHSLSLVAALHPADVSKQVELPSLCPVSGCHFCVNLFSEHLISDMALPADPKPLSVILHFRSQQSVGMSTHAITVHE